MSQDGESPLVAINLPPPEAAAAVRAAWEDGRAVLVLDPASPRALLERAIGTLRPESLVDGDGERRLRGGRPLAPGASALVASSGSTGLPKFVLLGGSALDASARGVNESLDVGAHDDRWLACVPMHHIAGLSIVRRGLVGGTPVTIHPRFDTDAVSEAAGECSLVSLVPTMLARLLEARAPLQEFRAILLGGGRVPDGLRERARTAGANVVETYGLTETCGGCVHNGRPLRGVEISLDDGGEVLVKGDVLMMGYHEDVGATEGVYTPTGWLRTGDRGEILPDGRLVVHERLDDLIITGGTNVSPGAVEQALLGHTSVADVCVTGVEDPEWGERVVAFVVAGTGPAPELGELRRFASATLRAAELPRQIVVVDEIPRTSNGKVRRHDLRRLALG